MSNNLPYVNINDLNNLARYATGASINHLETPILPTLGIMYVFEGGAWVLRNKKNFKEAFRGISAESAQNIQIRRASKNIFDATKKVMTKNELTAFAKSLPKDAAGKVLFRQQQHRLKPAEQ